MGDCGALGPGRKTPLSWCLPALPPVAVPLQPLESRSIPVVGVWLPRALFAQGFCLLLSEPAPGAESAGPAAPALPANPSKSPLPGRRWQEGKRQLYFPGRSAGCTLGFTPGATGWESWGELGGGQRGGGKALPAKKLGEGS